MHLELARPLAEDCSEASSYGADILAHDYGSSRSSVLGSGFSLLDGETFAVLDSVDQFVVPGQIFFVVGHIVALFLVAEYICIWTHR